MTAAATPAWSPFFTLRDATPDDVDDIVRLVHELATYEKEPDAVTATPDHVREALFPVEASPAAYGIIAERGGRAVGMAIWFTSFSTWTGRPGIWLEDLFVEPEHRGLGIGKAMLVRLAATCVERDWTRLEWAVLDWNEPSIAFYRSQGARAQDEWTTYRVDGPALASLARS